MENYFQALELFPWRVRNARTVTVETPPQDLQSLQQKVATCTLCDLHTSRTHTVFGSGDPHAKLMLIGEAPGFTEDQQGLPFVGRAGLLLTGMLKAIQLERSDVYIANVLKCRPPNNRDPSTFEVKTCTAYLNQQIQWVQPQLLVALGRVAAQYLLQNKQSLESLRNKIHHYGETAIPLIVTYHPAYLLRNPVDKKKSYQDLLYIQNTLSK